MKSRISIRGMAVASAVAAASTTVALAVTGLPGGDEVVAEPAADRALLPATASATLPMKPSGEQLAEIEEELRQEAARQRAAREAREARQARQERERASRSASRTPKFSGDARGIAASMAAESYGWGAGEFSCLDSLWERESGWDHTATNPSSGAYGIPQALPGSKMSEYGSDWRTDPVTQIQWGLSYIRSAHGTPCGAWNTFQSKGWY
ncbi:MAG: lytic transglycosylase domain-containing protein [Actinomycetes bacterium]